MLRHNILKKWITAKEEGIPLQKFYDDNLKTNSIYDKYDEQGKQLFLNNVFTNEDITKYKQENNVSADIEDWDFATSLKMGENLEKTQEEYRDIATEESKKGIDNPKIDKVVRKVGAWGTSTVNALPLLGWLDSALPENLQQLIKENEQNNPYASMAGAITGGLITGLATGGALGAMNSGMNPYLLRGITGLVVGGVPSIDEVISGETTVEDYSWNVATSVALQIASVLPEEFLPANNIQYLAQSAFGYVASKIMEGAKILQTGADPESFEWFNVNDVVGIVMDLIFARQDIKKELPEIEALIQKNLATGGRMNSPINRQKAKVEIQKTIVANEKALEQLAVETQKKIKVAEDEKIKLEEEQIKNKAKADKQKVKDESKVKEDATKKEITQINKQLKQDIETEKKAVALEEKNKKDLEIADKKETKILTKMKTDDINEILTNTNIRGANRASEKTSAKRLQYHLNHINDAMRRLKKLGGEQSELKFLELNEKRLEIEEFLKVAKRKSETLEQGKLKAKSDSIIDKTLDDEIVAILDNPKPTVEELYKADDKLAEGIELLNKNKDYDSADELQSYRDELGKKYDEIEVEPTKAEDVTKEESDTLELVKTEEVTETKPEKTTETKVEKVEPIKQPSNKEVVEPQKVEEPKPKKEEVPSNKKVEKKIEIDQEYENTKSTFIDNNGNKREGVIVSKEGSKNWKVKTKDADGNFKFSHWSKTKWDIEVEGSKPTEVEAPKKTNQHMKKLVEDSKKKIHPSAKREKKDLSLTKEEEAIKIADDIKRNTKKIDKVIKTETEKLNDIHKRLEEIDSLLDNLEEGDTTTQKKLEKEYDDLTEKATDMVMHDATSVVGKGIEQTISLLKKEGYRTWKQLEPKLKEVYQSLNYSQLEPLIHDLVKKNKQISGTGGLKFQPKKETVIIPNKLTKTGDVHAGGNIENKMADRILKAFHQGKELHTTELINKISNRLNLPKTVSEMIKKATNGKTKETMNFEDKKVLQATIEMLKENSIATQKAVKKVQKRKVTDSVKKIDNQMKNLPKQTKTEKVIDAVREISKPITDVTSSANAIDILNRNTKTTGKSELHDVMVNDTIVQNKNRKKFKKKVYDMVEGEIANNPDKYTKLGDLSNGKKKFILTTKDGKDITLTQGQFMNLAMVYMSEISRNPNVYDNSYIVGSLKRKFRDIATFKITPEEMAIQIALTRKTPEGAKLFNTADLTFKTFKNTIAPELERVVRDVYGMPLDLIENYYGIVGDITNLGESVMGYKQKPNMSSSGMLKTRKGGSIVDLNVNAGEVFTNNIAKATNIIESAEHWQHARQVLNEMKTKFMSDGNYETSDKKYLVETLDKMIREGELGDSTDPIPIIDAISKNVSSVLLWNAKVASMQALSLGTGMAHEFNGMSLSPSDLVQLSSKNKLSTSELTERFPILWDRWLHADISEEMNLVKKNSKIRDWGAKGMIFMDKKTITKGFNAINNMYVKKYGKDFKGLDDMVDAHFRDWYYKTQPTYDKELLPRAVMGNKLIRHTFHKFTSAIRKNGAMVRESFARFNGSEKNTKDYAKLVKNVGYTVMVNATVSWLNSVLANKMEQSKGEGMTKDEFNNMVIYGTAVNTISMFNPLLGAVARSIPYGGEWKDPMARTITLALQNSMSLITTLKEGKTPTKEQLIDGATGFDMLVTGYGLKGAEITYKHTKALADVTAIYIKEQGLTKEFEQRKLERREEYDKLLKNEIPEREIPTKEVTPIKTTMDKKKPFPSYVSKTTDKFTVDSLLKERKIDPELVSSVDAGLFQINSGYWGDSIEKGDLFDPDYNLKVAKKVFNAQNYKGWTTFKSGKYKEYLDKKSKYHAKIVEMFPNDHRIMEAIMLAESGGNPRNTNINYKNVDKS